MQVSTPTLISAKKINSVVLSRGLRSAPALQGEEEFCLDQEGSNDLSLPVTTPAETINLL